MIVETLAILQIYAFSLESEAGVAASPADDEGLSELRPVCLQYVGERPIPRLIIAMDKIGDETYLIHRPKEDTANNRRGLRAQLQGPPMFSLQRKNRWPAQGGRTGRERDGKGGGCVEGPKSVVHVSEPGETWPPFEPRKRGKQAGRSNKRSSNAAARANLLAHQQQTLCSDKVTNVESSTGKHVCP